MLVLFAFAFIAMVSVVGLVVDGGNLMVQRRTAQNAADAAALAGARALARATSATDSTIAAAICAYLVANKYRWAPTATAEFIDATGASVSAIGLTSDCQGVQSPVLIPGSASGVKVGATIGSIPTYFLAVAGIKTQSVSAVASGAASQLTSITPGGPIVAGCGGSMYENGGGTYDGTVNIFVGGIPPNINYAAYTGRTFKLLGRDLRNGTSGPNTPPAYPTNPACPRAGGTGGFWGAINSTGAIALPADITTLTGDYDVSSAMQSMCTATGQAIPTFTSSNCYLPVPITGPSGNGSSYAHIVSFGCMQIFGRGGSQNDRWDGVLATPSKCPAPPGSTFAPWSFAGGSAILAVALSS
jgi:Flp pilus assembly protein TadG